MRRFSLFELVLAVTLFGVGISSGWLARGYTWQSKLKTDAKHLAANDIAFYVMLHEGELFFNHQETLDLGESRQRQIFETLFQRNGIEAPTTK